MCLIKLLPLTFNVVTSAGRKPVEDTNKYCCARYLSTHLNFVIRRVKVVEIMLSLILIIPFVSFLVIITWIYRKFKPYVEFARKHKHRSGFPLELLKIGYEGASQINLNYLVKFVKFIRVFLQHIQIATRNSSDQQFDLDTIHSGLD